MWTAKTEVTSCCRHNMAPRHNTKAVTSHRTVPRRSRSATAVKLHHNQNFNISPVPLFILLPLQQRGCRLRMTHHQQFTWLPKHYCAAQCLAYSSLLTATTAVIATFLNCTLHHTYNGYLASKPISPNTTACGGIDSIPSATPYAS
jgi:hypothetical protein